MGLVRLLNEAYQRIDCEGAFSSLLKKQMEDSSLIARPIFERLGLLSESEVDHDADDKEAFAVDPVTNFRLACSHLWLKIEQTSSIQPMSDLKSYLLSTIQCNEVYIDSTQWLNLAAKRLHAVYSTYQIDAVKAICCQDITEGFDKFDDFSDIIKDVIKSVKVLITFDIKDEVEEELLVPHFNISPVRREMQRNKIRRLIGAR